MFLCCSVLTYGPVEVSFFQMVAVATVLKHIDSRQVSVVIERYLTVEVPARLDRKGSQRTTLAGPRTSSYCTDVDLSQVLRNSSRWPQEV